MPPSEPSLSEEPRAERREQDREPDGRGLPLKERLLKDDGRYIIFYDFADRGEG